MQIANKKLKDRIYTMKSAQSAYNQHNQALVGLNFEPHFFCLHII